MRLFGGLHLFLKYASYSKQGKKSSQPFNIYHNKGKSGDIPYNLVESVERDVNLTQD